MTDEPEDSKAQPSQPEAISVAAGGTQSEQPAVSSQPTEVMPKRIFYLELGYIVALQCRQFSTHRLERQTSGIYLLH